MHSGTAKFEKLESSLTRQSHKALHFENPPYGQRVAHCARQSCPSLLSALPEIEDAVIQDIFSDLINSMKAFLIRILIEDEQTARHQQH